MPNHELVVYQQEAVIGRSFSILAILKAITYM